LIRIIPHGELHTGMEPVLHNADSGTANILDLGHSPRRPN
jgi:hypothetical protein